MSMATLHQGLLKQAFHLARKEPRKPSQASLRRSVSASYYALFHYLVDEATNYICGVKDLAIKYYLVRTFEHGNMKKVAERFSQESTPENLYQVVESRVLDRRLVQVATSFVFLQDLRIAADYDLSISLERDDVIAIARLSESAFSAWKKIRCNIQARVFLLGLHNQKNINSRYSNANVSDLLERITG